MTPVEATHSLFQAVKGNNVKATRAALAAGADATARDHWQRTPLHFAAENGSIEIAGLLIENGADPSAQDHQGRAPLHLAARDGHVAVVHLLIAKGVESLSHKGWFP